MKNVVFVARLRAVDEQLQGGAGKKDSGVKSKKRNKSPTASKFTLYNQKSNRYNNNSNTTITTNSANNMNNNKSTTISSLNHNINYTFFTSNPTSDVLCISSKPINGKTICDNFHNKNDIFEFNKTILKDSSLLEYDYIYNETSPITKIYTEQIKDKITNLFHGYNSCILLYGPTSSGKSYLLRGNHIQQHHPTNNKALTENSGLLLHAVHDLFGLLSLTKQTQTHYIIKISSYQIYMDTITDLLCKEKHNNQIKLEKYYDNNHNINCAMIGLRKLIIRNQSDFDLCLKEIIHQRKTISNTMNIKDMKRKSHFVISFTIEKRNVIINETTNKEENEIEMHSQIDFVELASSDYAFYGDNNNNEDKSLDGIMCRNISKSFNSLCDAVVCASSGMSMKNETKLTLCLKNTIRHESKIVFVNCIVPWEYPINESYKGVKFTNWLRNQVINVEGNRQCNKRECASSYESNTIQSEGCVDVNNRKSMLNINDYNVNVGNISKRSGKDNTMQRRFNTLDSENKNISSIIMNPYDNVNTNSNSNNLRCFNGNNNNSGLYRTTQSNDISFDPSIITSNPKHVKQLQNISNSLNQLNNKSFTLANTLKHETQQQPMQHQYQHSFNNNNNSNTSFPDIDKIKTEYASLKSDNIIYKEDISRLTKSNNLLETELQLQRTRNIELTSTIEQLQSQLTAIESKHNIIQSKLENGTLIELDPSKTTSDTLYQALSSKLSLECKVKDLSNEITNLTESKQQLQVELSLLQERYDKLYQQYQCVVIDNKNVTCNYNMQYNSIEGKVNELMKEMERMKEENTQLKLNEERLIRDKNDKDKEIERIRRKYENELDNVNDLQIKLNGIKREYEKVIQEKENEEYLKMKENEYMQRKNESKLKAMNDLHNKISQYKSERLKKKQQQQQEEQDDDNTPTNTNIIVTE